MGARLAGRSSVDERRTWLVMFLSSSACVGAAPPPPIEGSTGGPEGSTSSGPGTIGTGTSSGGTSSGGTSSSAESSSTTGTAVPPACTAYGDAITLCYDAEAGASAAQYCAEVFANYETNYGAECVAAFEEWLACLSALTCEELTGADPVCPDQQGTLETVCAAM